MYTIIALNNGTFQCNITIQDGTESWNLSSKEKAIQSLISAAYTMNHSRINEDMIRFVYETPKVPRQLLLEEEVLLEQIKTGHKVVLDHDDFRLKANLLEREIKMLYDIREGKLRVS